MPRYEYKVQIVLDREIEPQRLVDILWDAVEDEGATDVDVGAQPEVLPEIQ